MILDYIAASIYLAILYVMVRPGSPGANIVKTLFSTLVAVVGEATGSSALGGSSNPSTSTGTVSA